MLHEDYLTPGARVTMQELEGVFRGVGSVFEVKSLHPGGMGVCIHLRDTMSEQEIGLKCVRPELLGDKEAIDRFRDELEVWLMASVCTGVVEAGGIVRVNEIPCVAARWMPGGDLSLQLSTLSVREKLLAIIRLVKTLQWVHRELGVMHRDLKPANVLLDRQKVAYLTDWGLARPVKNAIQRAANSNSKTQIERADRTTVGTFLGTLHYAAPEQLMGRKTVDHRADIYALGCMMFEMEAGRPPFLGLTHQDVIQQHLNRRPVMLGGVFKKTALRLEKITARCLEKKPESRYQDYSILLADIVEIAKSLNIDVSNCNIEKRYERYQLGRGLEKETEVLQSSWIGRKEFGLVEMDRLEPFLVEASQLMALNRYKEAADLLAPLYIPDLTSVSGPWDFGHSLALAYACCLQNLTDKKGQALDIYENLSRAAEAPAEYYVNYSLALIQAKRLQDAHAACETGLTSYPDDLDLLGNYSIALIHLDQLAEALAYSARRLGLRKDVHSIAEHASAIAKYRDRMRDYDLPSAMVLAEQGLSWVREGLKLNPSFGTLLMAELDCYRFAEDQVRVIEACEKIYNSENVPVGYRQLAALEFIRQQVKSLQYQSALELLKDHLANEMTPSIREAFQTEKWRIYANHFMIGQVAESGERIVLRQVLEYFIADESSYVRDRLMSARILMWIGRIDEAAAQLEICREESSQHWDATKELILLEQQRGNLNRAQQLADDLARTAPWRAESFDNVSYIAEQRSDLSTASKAKSKAEKVFAEEMQYFKAFREKL